MTTLLQKLLIETLPKNSVVRSYIDTILPAMERLFKLAPALGGSQQPFSKNADQSLISHVLNGLLTAWNLSNNLSEPLSEIEQKALCLGFTLHDYDKYFKSCDIDAPGAHQTSDIREKCRKLGEQLNFHDFWSDWSDYLLDICFLAQNTQGKRGSNLASSNWEIDGFKFRLIYPDRERLCQLLRFGDIAVHVDDPAEITLNTSTGKQLQKCFDQLDIQSKLVYHRLRDCRGLLTNQTHNAVMKFVSKLKWEPILYFAQGVAYLAPIKPGVPNLSDIQEAVWENILKGDRKTNQEGLEDYFTNGDVGFIRDGKGLKVAPLTLELFPPADLIRQLSLVMIAKVKNKNDPATPKRLEKLDLSDEERKFLANGSNNVWADRLAELIVLTQRELFETGNQREQYINWVLTDLGLHNQISAEKTQIQSGGVNYGWYQVAAHYIASLPDTVDRSPESDDIRDLLSDFSDRLANWAEEKHLFPKHTSPTRDAFFQYLAQYLEISAWQQPGNSEFQCELTAYTEAKEKNKPICSLSSGEFSAEDQLESVVLFKPQQYSNKNALGGGRIKRGISKIWSLEMLLRQAYWAAPAGKLEEQQPIFLYIFPAYVYSPQVACAVGVLFNQLEKVNLWDVYKQWKNDNMQLESLYNLSWLGKEPKAGRYGTDYSKNDLPFMAMRYTRTLGVTLTDAWVQPVFLALALPMLLGVKVVATASQDPLYSSDKEFLETVKLDGPAGFWNLLGLDSSLRLDNLQNALERLLIAYSIHLDNRSAKPDARWQAFNGTVRDLATNVLNVFAIANEGLRHDKREPSSNEVDRYWKFAQIWSKGDVKMEKTMQFTQDLVRKYRQFYQVDLKESSHAILLPVTKALEVILSSPNDLDPEDLIFQGAGQLHDALDRQETYKRPFLMDKSVDYALRQQQELEAIYSFMTTCVNEIFLGQYKGDRALLQENRNRIKAGAEFAYRWLHIQEKPQAKADNSATKGDK